MLFAAVVQDLLHTLRFFFADVLFDALNSEALFLELSTNDLESRAQVSVEIIGLAFKELMVEIVDDLEAGTLIEVRVCLRVRSNEVAANTRRHNLKMSLSRWGAPMDGQGVRKPVHNVEHSKEARGVRVGHSSHSSQFCVSSVSRQKHLPEESAKDTKDSGRYGHQPWLPPRSGV